MQVPVLVQEAMELLDLEEHPITLQVAELLVAAVAVTTEAAVLLVPIVVLVKVAEVRHGLERFQILSSNQALGMAMDRLRFLGLQQIQIVL